VAIGGRSTTGIDIVRIKPRFAERVSLEDDDDDTGVAPSVRAERLVRQRPL
jgi:hypothetical protein